MNRYFRVSSKAIFAIDRYTRGVSRYRQPSPKQRAALAKALGVSDPYWHEPARYGEHSPTVSDIIDQAAGEAWIQEGTRSDIAADRGAGWIAVYTGEERGPADRLGTHIDDLSDYQREYVERAARNAGIALHESETT